jgi:predicted DNA binding CopG/RHH family protein
MSKSKKEKSLEIQPKRNQYRDGVARKEVYLPEENLHKLKIKAAHANISLKEYIENVLVKDSNE